MKFGVREICDVVFKAKAKTTIGAMTVEKGQPVLYIDTAKTSNLEAAATTVYATGGRGNTRLIAWEGEKTLTFTVEDALLSPMGFAMLSGAGLMNGYKDTDKAIIVHGTTMAPADADGKIDITDALKDDDGVLVDIIVDGTKPLFVMATEEDGSLSTFQRENYTVEMVKIGDIIKGDGEEVEDKTATADDQKVILIPTEAAKAPKNTTVFVDYYTKRYDGAMQFEIDGENFAGYYYVEAATLWRRQDNGKDMPAELIFPNVKIQSNFTFAMASTGDPSTFTFTMDAMPGYTVYDGTKKVLCAIQVIGNSAKDVAGAMSSVDSLSLS